MITVTRSTELEEWAREARRRFEGGDSAWFEETTAYGDVGGFGTAEEEQSIGRDEVLALTKSQIDEMHEASGLDMAEAAKNPDEDVMEGMGMLPASSVPVAYCSRSSRALFWRSGRHAAVFSFFTPAPPRRMPCSSASTCPPADGAAAIPIGKPAFFAACCGPASPANSFAPALTMPVFDGRRRSTRRQPTRSLVYRRRPLL